MEENKGFDPKSVHSLIQNWRALDSDVRKEHFRSLPKTEAEDLFLGLGPMDQYELINEYTPVQTRSWIRLLAPDDAADLIQHYPLEARAEILNQLDENSLRDVLGLLAYAEDDAGGLMSTRYIRLRPEMTVEEAIRYIRAQARNPVEIIYYAYVLDSHQRLKGVVSFRDLFLAPPTKKVQEIMQTDLLTLREDVDQEEVSRQFSSHDLMAIPVLDAEGVMKGIVTVDDIVGVVEEEATEDIQKLGGMQAMDAPYFNVGLVEMVRKRGVWLTILFVGEMFTVSAMGHFKSEIENAILLAIFIPLIISSGGNSGSQASTLIIRALALNEIRLRDWWRVFLRELSTGLVLGAVLGLIGGAMGALRVFWLGDQGGPQDPNFMIIGAIVSISLVGVVLWGSLTGAMLPFVLRRLGLDPATASAPLVATLVDVTGLVIYFSVASILLTL